MSRFKLKASKKEFTSYAGLALVGQCLDMINVEAVVDGRIPVSQGIKTSDIVKSATGLLSIGKSDFEAIEPFREDRFFKQALNLRKVPGSVWLRQRLDRVSGALREPLDEMSVRLIERAVAPITPHKGYVCLDMDTFVMDQSGSKKEDVSRTYQGVDGYTPVAAYLGNEGWCVGLELRPGRWHSSLEIEYFLERLLPRVERLVPAEQAVLMRKDSGFDSAKLLFAAAAENSAGGEELLEFAGWHAAAGAGDFFAVFVHDDERGHACDAVGLGVGGAVVDVDIHAHELIADGVGDGFLGQHFFLHLLAGRAPACGEEEERGLAGLLAVGEGGFDWNCGVEADERGVASITAAA